MPPSYVPNFDRVGHENVKKIIDEHLKKYPGLLNSSQGKDIVVFLGDTGAGKSTLINYLTGQKLKTNEYQDIVLGYSNDPEALPIGGSHLAQTFLPRSIRSGDLLFFDLPGFGDNRGTATSLLNACFIKSIIEKAKSVKLVFVAGMDEITGKRGKSFIEFMRKIEQLIPGTSIERFSSLVITKSHQKREKLNDYLAVKTEMTPILQSWISNNMLGQMSKPEDSIIRDDERAPILDLIRRTGQEKIPNINIDAIFDAHEQQGIKEIYDAEIKNMIVRLQRSEAQGISDLGMDALTNKKAYMDSGFKQAVYSSLLRSPLIALLRPISENLFQSSWQEQERDLRISIIEIGSQINEKINAILKRDRDRRKQEQESIEAYGWCSKTSNHVHDISKEWHETNQYYPAAWFFKCNACGQGQLQYDENNPEHLMSPAEGCSLQ